MATIEPFTGVIYNQRVEPDLGMVLAPPYDVISSNMQDELYERSPHNVVRLILGRQFSDDGDANNRYTRAAGVLRNWMGDGTLTRTEAPAIYLYAQRYTVEGIARERVGFMCRIKLSPLGKDVHPHERTLAGPKLDRLMLTRACRMNFSPVFGLYADEGRALDGMFGHYMASAVPDVDVTDGEGVEHRMWIITDPAVTGEAKRFMADKPVVIADGHHRYETALNYRNERRAAEGDPAGDQPYDFGLMYLSNIHGQGFTVLPTHRMAGELASAPTAETLANKLAADFDITPLRANHARVDELMAGLRGAGAKGPSFAVYTGGGKALLITLKPGITAPAAGAAAELLGRLDVIVLQELVFEKALGVTKADVEAKRRVSYTIDPREAMGRVDEGAVNFAFLMNPTGADQVMRVALGGGVMPQKSTYFYPKLISGLVMNPLY